MFRGRRRNDDDEQNDKQADRQDAKQERGRSPFTRRTEDDSGARRGGMPGRGGSTDDDDSDFYRQYGGARDRNRGPAAGGRSPARASANDDESGSRGGWLRRGGGDSDAADNDADSGGGRFGFGRGKKDDSDNKPAKPTGRFGRSRDSKPARSSKGRGDRKADKSSDDKGGGRFGFGRGKKDDSDDDKSTRSKPFLGGSVTDRDRSAGRGSQGRRASQGRSSQRRGSQGRGSRPGGDRSSPSPGFRDRAGSGDRPGGTGPTFGSRDRPGDRPGGDRPGGAGSALGGRDRPPSSLRDRSGDRPGGDRPGGDRPGSALGNRDRPGGDRPGGTGSALGSRDRPGSSLRDRPGDRPGGDRPGGDRPGGAGSAFGSRDRTGSSLRDRPGAPPGGDRPGGDRPGGAGSAFGSRDRTGDRPGSDRASGPRPGFRDRPGGEMPRRSESQQRTFGARGGASPVVGVGKDDDKNKKDEKRSSKRRFSLGRGKKDDEKKDDKPLLGGRRSSRAAGTTPPGQDRAAGSGLGAARDRTSRPGALGERSRPPGATGPTPSREAPGTSPRTSRRSAGRGTAATGAAAGTAAGAARTPARTPSKSRSASKDRTSKAKSRTSAAARSQTRARPLPGQKDKGALTMHQGLDFDRKIDLMGVALFAFALVTFFSVVPSVSMGVLPEPESGLTFALNEMLSQIFGWGRIIVPIAALGVGIWLMRESFNETGIELDYFRIIGMIMLFTCALTWLQMIELFNNTQPSIEAFRPYSYELAIDDGGGGGWIGHQLYIFLLSQLLDFGTISVMIAWAVMGLMLTFDLSVVEIWSYVAGLFAFAHFSRGDRAQQRAARRILKADEAPIVRPGEETQQLTLGQVTAGAAATATAATVTQTASAVRSSTPTPAPAGAESLPDRPSPRINRRGMLAGSDAESSDQTDEAPQPATAQAGNSAAGTPEQADPALQPSRRRLPHLRRRESDAGSDAGDVVAGAALAAAAVSPSGDSSAAKADDTSEQAQDSESGKRRFGFLRRGKSDDTAGDEVENADEKQISTDIQTADSAADAAAARSGRGRFSPFARRVDDADSDDDAPPIPVPGRTPASEDRSDQAAESTTKRRFGLRGRSMPDAAEGTPADKVAADSKDAATESAPESAQTSEAESSNGQQRGGLFGRLRRSRKKPDETAAGEAATNASAPDSADDKTKTPAASAPGRSSAPTLETRAARPTPDAQPSDFRSERDRRRPVLSDPLSEKPDDDNGDADAAKAPSPRAAQPEPSRRADDQPDRERGKGLDIAGTAAAGAVGAASAAMLDRRERREPLEPGDSRREERPGLRRADTSTANDPAPSAPAAREPALSDPALSDPAQGGHAPRPERPSPLERGPQPERSLPSERGPQPDRAPLGATPAARPQTPSARDADSKAPGQAAPAASTEDKALPGPDPSWLRGRDAAPRDADASDKIRAPYSGRPVRDISDPLDSVDDPPAEEAAKDSAASAPERAPQAAPQTGPKPDAAAERPARPIPQPQRAEVPSAAQDKAAEPPAPETAKAVPAEKPAVEQAARIQAAQTPVAQPQTAQPPAAASAVPAPASPAQPERAAPAAEKAQPPKPDAEATRTASAATQPAPAQTQNQQPAARVDDRPAPPIRRRSLEGRGPSAVPAARREPEPAAAARGTNAPERRAPRTPLQPDEWRVPDFRRLLKKGSEQRINDEILLDKARVIEDTLASFGAPGKVVEVNPGPVITQFGIEPDYLLGRGGKRTRIKVNQIAKLDADLALALAAKTIRIEAPVPGKGFVGIEVPNDEVALVNLYDIMDSPEFMRIDSKLRIALGLGVDGSPVAADLTAMPHLLIAGTTGSGKSVCVNSIITSLLLQNTPHDLQFIMVDPKRVELTGYNGIPHLVAPVVVELERIVGVLQWVQREMEERYRKFAAVAARNIIDYNNKVEDSDSRIPYYVVVVDELADLMMLAPDETERLLARLAQMARATGIHLIISTQRPSVDIITGLIKANFPARIAFAVASSVDSRVILDQPGAEKLLGRGDMLFQSPDAAAPLRMQGVFVSDNDINTITRYWKGLMLDQADAEERETIASPRSDIKFNRMGPGSSAPNEPAPERRRSSRPAQRPLWNEESESDDGDRDELYTEAVEMVQRLNKASISLLQRRLRIGYTRAARLIDIMEEEGIIGPSQEGSKPREVIKHKIESGDD